MNKITPKALGVALYGLAGKITRGLVQGMVPDVRLWLRNSFVLGALRPFLSDLDLTVWFEKEPTRTQIDRLVSLLRLLKGAFPFLGETNSYTPATLSAGSIANVFELERDPTLKSRLSEPPLFSDKIMGAVFLCRMLEGDIDNVLFRPAERKAKWDSHVEMVAKKTGKALRSPWQGYPARSLLRGIVELVVDLAELGDGEAFQRAVTDLERYFECIGRGVPAHVLEMSGTLKIFFPHRFCFFEGAVLSEAELAGNRLQCILAEFAWELWGQMGQRLLARETERERVRGHLKSIEKFCGGAMSKADVRVRGAFEKGLGILYREG